MSEDAGHIVVDIGVDDSASVLSYFPFSDPRTPAPPNEVLPLGWIPATTVGGFATTLGSPAQGPSSHLTAHDGAQVQLDVNGPCNVSLFGAVRSPAFFAISIDNSPSPQFSNITDIGFDPSGNGQLLATVENLPSGPHRITLTAHSDGSNWLAFDRTEVRLDAGVASGDASVVTTTLQDTQIPFTGQWTFVPESGGGSEHVSSALGDSFSSNFTGTAVSLFGTRSPMSGQYNVSIDGATPETFDGFSSFNITDALLFFRTGLAQTQHIIQVTNISDNGTLSVDFLNITSVPGNLAPASPASSGFSKGTIAALVLAGIIAFLVVAGFGAFLFLRRRRTKRHAMRLTPAPSRRSTKSPSDRILDIISGALDDSDVMNAGQEADFEQGHARKDSSTPIMLDFPHSRQLSFSRPIPPQEYATRRPFTSLLSPIPASHGRGGSSSSEGGDHRPRITSFLSMASSAASSLRGKRSRSGSKSDTHSSLKRSSNGATTGALGDPQFTFSLAVTTTPPRSAPPALATDSLTPNVHRMSAPGLIDHPEMSPTETVSEIHFRPAPEVTDARPASGSVDTEEGRWVSGENLPPHPPLSSVAGLIRGLQRLPPDSAPRRPLPEPPDSRRSF